MEKNAERRIQRADVEKATSGLFLAEKSLTGLQRQGETIWGAIDAASHARYLLNRLWAQYEREQEAAISGAMAMMEKLDALKLSDGWIRVEMLESEYDRMRAELGERYEFQGQVKLTVNGKP